MNCNRCHRTMFYCECRNDPTRPMRYTIRNRRDQRAEFVAWCESRGIDPETIESPNS